MDPVFSSIYSWNLISQQNVAKQMQTKFRHMRDQIKRARKTSATYFLWDELQFIFENEKGWLPETPQDDEQVFENILEHENEDLSLDEGRNEEGTQEENVNLNLNETSSHEQVRPISCVNKLENPQAYPTGERCQNHVLAIDNFLETMQLSQMKLAIHVMFQLINDDETENVKENIVNICPEAEKPTPVTSINMSLYSMNALKRNFVNVLKTTIDQWVEEKYEPALKKLRLCWYICDMGLKGRLCEETAFKTSSNPTTTILNYSDISIDPQIIIK